MNFLYMSKESKKVAEIMNEKTPEDKRNMAVVFMATASVAMAGEIAFIINDVSEKVYSSMYYIPY